MSSVTCTSARISRRAWCLTTLLGATVACARKKGTGYNGYALVATSGEHTVAAVDLTAFRLAKTIPLPGEPAEIVTDGAGRAFALCPSIGTITVIDDHLRVLFSRKIADRVSKLRLMPDGKSLVALSPDDHEVLQMSAERLDISHRRRLHDRPGSLNVASSGHVAVGASETGSIDLLSFQTGEWKHTELKNPVDAVLFRDDGQLLLATGPAERLITALSVPDLHLITELSLAMEPRNLCFTPDGGQLFVSGPGMDGVAIVFPYKMVEVEQTVLAGRDPGVMACSADSSYLFVASSSGSDVSILRVDTRKDVGAVEVGERPSYISVTPDGQYALVLSEASGDVAVIRIAAIRANREKSGVALFTMLPVGPKPVHCGFLPRQLG